MSKISKLKLFFDWTDKNVIKKIEPIYKFIWFIIQIVLWVALLFFITPILAGLFKSVFNKDVGLSDFILLITAAFIIFYTFETQKMRKQMETAKEAEFMPVVIFDPNSSNTLYHNEHLSSYNHDSFLLHVSNLGRGIAKELIIYMNGCRISSHISVLVGADPIGCHLYITEMPEEILQLLDRKPTKINMRLEYKDIYQNEFCTECTFDREGVNYKINPSWNFYQL